MTKQLIFAITLLITLGVFAFTVRRIVSFFKFTRPAFPVKNFGKRFRVMMNVAFGQTKIFRIPVLGLIHALVFWGFCIIIFGSIEMVADGLTGTEKILRILGPFYDFLMATGDIFALIIAVSIIIFLSRRLFFHIKRFPVTNPVSDDFPSFYEHRISWIYRNHRRYSLRNIPGRKNVFKSFSIVFIR